MKAPVLCDATRMEATSRTAGNKVMMAEKAAALATANWSCCKARQKA